MSRSRTTTLTTLVVTAPEQLRALADPLRAALLELPLERAATVTEMARALDQPRAPSPTT